MDDELEADLDALLILYHDMKRGGEFGNWNAPIVKWARQRIDGKIEDAIQRTINRLNGR